MSTPFSIDDVIAAASPVERVVSVCVAGKLVGEYEQLKRELENSPGAGRLGSSTRTTDIQARLVELEAEMQAATYDFRFRALPAKKWSDLLSAHPSKDKNRLFDVDTFVPAAIAACCVEPAGMDDPEKVEALVASLSTAQQGELFDGAWEVNTSAPKGLNSFTASAALRDFVKNSSSAASEESPAASS